MKIASFYKEVKAEALRVVWPSRKEAFMSVALVLAMVCVAGLFFVVADALLFKLVRLVLG